MPGNVRPVADEREGLMAYLAQQRSVLQIAAYGLTDEQARAVPTRSGLSVGGLVKHVTSVERSWVDIVLQRQPEHRRTPLPRWPATPTRSRWARPRRWPG